MFDRVLPTVQITSFVGGMLKGTVTDNYLDYWEIAVKEKMSRKVLIASW